MWEAISNLLSAVGAALGLIQQRDDEKNTPEMRERKEAQDRVNTDDQIERDVAERDVDAVRKELAE